MAQRIIIIGASSGIGRKLALAYAASGCKVAISARRDPLLKEIAAHYPDNITYSTMDVGAADAVDTLHRMIDSLGGLDLLIYCAGTGFCDPELTPEKLGVTLHTNVNGFASIISAAYRYFRDRTPREPAQIAAITSVAATKGIGVSAAYSASKSFEQKFLEAIAQLAHINRLPLTVTDIRPGFIRTDLLDASRHYPMLMSPDYATRLVMSAIRRGRSVDTVDWRWRLLTAAWHLIPRPIWVRLNINF